jgi:hemoglobin/transferrin/lactoferrin receptor protein
MKRFYTGLCLVLFALGMRAQTVTVLDAETDEPLEWVTLKNEQTQMVTTTNAKGQADLSIFSATDVIKLIKFGYGSLSISYGALKQNGFIVHLNATRLNLNEIVISATRWQQSSGNLPVKIATITPREIAIQNPQTAADLLAISGKVYIQKSQQGGGSPMIRGFATNRLIYTVDGVRMNTAIFRGGNIQNVINLDPFATENAEVLFGPNSVIYGSDAIGGVMSFQTLVPELSITDEPLVVGKAISRYSSANNERTGHFDMNIGWKKWAFVTSFSSWHFDDLRQGSNGPEDYLKPYYVQRIDSTDQVITQDDPLLQKPTAYTQTNVMQKVRFKPNAFLDFRYGFHYSETSPYGRYDRHNRMRKGLPRYAEWNYGPQKWMMNNLTVTHQKPNGVYDIVTLRLARQDFEESRIDRSLNNVNRSTQTEEVVAYSANIDFTKKLAQKHNLYYGAEYVINNVTSTGHVTDIGTGQSMASASRYPNSTWHSFGIYVNDEFNISSQLSLLGGVRYTRYSLSSDFTNNLDYYPFSFATATMQNDALTGSIGSVFRPSSNWIISMNIATAFRAPNVDDIGKVFDSEPGAVTVPNPNLAAEYAYNADLSVGKVFGKVLKIDLTGYYTILQNALVRRPFTLNGADSIMYDGQLSQVQAIQNAALARVYGLQAGLELQLPAGFSFSSDLNWQEGKEELDNGSLSPSRHAAPFFGISRFTYRANKLTLEFYATYQGERTFDALAVEERAKDEIYAKDVNGNNYAPSWYTVNIKAMYQFMSNLTITAGLENITDQRYRPYSSGISSPGRNFVMALRATF